jgi:hypothetical protein
VDAVLARFAAIFRPSSVVTNSAIVMCRNLAPFMDRALEHRRLMNEPFQFVEAVFGVRSASACDLAFM